MSQSDTGWLSRSNLFMIAIVISGGFISILNQTVLSPALPSIMRDFQIDASQGQWLTTAFLLVNGIMVPITAYLIDRFSTRFLFIGSMGIFAAGTALAAVSPSYEVLIVARIVQALGAGIQFPLGSVVMMLMFPKEKRGSAMGMVGIVIAFAPAIGPTLSGWIVDQWNWHTIFAIIVPLAVADIIFAAFMLKNVSEPKHPSLDWLSVALSTLAFGGLLYGFSFAGTYGWTSASTIGPLLVGTVTLVFYIRRQLALPEPLLQLRVLKSKVFTYATILGMITQSALMVGTIILPILVQTILGYTATQSGLLMLPGAIIMGIMSPISGTLFDRFGPRTLSLVGLTITVVTSWLLVASVNPDSTFWQLCFIFTTRAFGMSMVNMPINTWGINALDNSIIAHGNAVSNTARQLASSIGTAILVTLMTITVTANSALGYTTANIMGIRAAFAGSAVLTVAALVLAYFKVKPVD